MLKCNGFFFLYVTDFGVASSWNLSMEQCRIQHSSYLLGEVILNNPRILCNKIIQFHISVVWVGVRRQKYKNIDQGIYKYLIYTLTLFNFRKKITLSCNFVVVANFHYN